MVDLASAEVQLAALEVAEMRAALDRRTAGRRPDGGFRPATHVPLLKHGGVNGAVTMRTGVRVLAIDASVAAELRVRDDAGRAPRLVADEGGGSPLRCCLRRSEPGETIALVSYAPLRRWARQTHADPGPYDEVGPVFIHPSPCAGPAAAGFPADFTGQRRVLRCYGADGRILDGRLAEAAELADVEAGDAVLAQMFADPAIALVHARAVEFGCFTFEARRAG
jgi:Protein of unknown function (DUF1203)